MIEIIQSYRRYSTKKKIKNFTFSELFTKSMISRINYCMLSIVCHIIKVPFHADAHFQHQNKSRDRNFDEYQVSIFDHMIYFDAKNERQHEP